MSFAQLVLRNLAVRRFRSTLTALVVAVGVLTVVTLGIVLSSIRSSARSRSSPGSRLSTS